MKIQLQPGDKCYIKFEKSKKHLIIGEQNNESNIQTVNRASLVGYNYKVRIQNKSFDIAFEGRWPVGNLANLGIVDSKVLGNDFVLPYIADRWPNVMIDVYDNNGATDSKIYLFEEGKGKQLPDQIFETEKEFQSFAKDYVTMQTAQLQEKE
ncbi:MAG: hypothetical protein K6F08_01190 [bacterium]|nr:hypothetical protein [bacterium]